ncbi:MAG: BTAD domain-containing putative transcriptional regulator, partial [Cyanobacteria bacterium P01_D01_bin.44]
ELLQTLKGHQKCIWSLSWSANGQMLASGSDDQSIRLWNTPTGRCFRSLQAHQNAVRSIQWQPSSPVQSGASAENRLNPSHREAILASGSFDQTVRLWSPRADASLKVLQGYRNAFQTLAWHPNGQLLASGGHDRLVRLWETRTGKCRMALEGHTRPVWAVAWSRDGQTLASSGDDQTIRLWDVRTQQMYATLQGHQGSLWGLAWHPQDAILASVSHDQTVRLWNVETRRCLSVLTGHQNFVRTVAWSPDGKLLATGSYDQMLRLWDPETGRCLKVLEDPDNWVWQLAFSPDGKTLATGSTNGDIKLWEMPTGNPLKTLKGHQNSVWSLAWRPNGHTLISSSHDQTVRIWRVGDGQCLHTLEGHTNLIWRMALNPDGRTIASCGSDETIRLWDAIAGTCLNILRPMRPYEGMNITHVRGLTEAQRINLRALGAIAPALSDQFAISDSPLNNIPSSENSLVGAQGHSPGGMVPLRSTSAPLRSERLSAEKSPLTSSEESQVSSSPISTEPPLVIRLLGGLSLIYNHEAIHNIGSSRTQWLLTYLLLHRHAPQSRQQIAFSLWPDSLDSQARTNLRKELHNLRRHLPNADEYLEVNANALGWRANSPFWLDSAAFEQALADAETCSDAKTAQPHLDQAVSLYQGDLLPAFHEEWILPIRENLHQRFLQALTQLVEALKQQENYQAALSYAEQLLRLDPLRESTYRQLMQIHDLKCDRATALQVYHQCMIILREELGIDPSPATQSLYEKLLG